MSHVMRVSREAFDRFKAACEAPVDPERVARIKTALRKIHREQMVRPSLIPAMREGWND